MFQKAWRCILTGVILNGMASSVRADEIAELRRQMEQQYEQMRQMQNKLIELEAAQKQQKAAVQKREGTSGPKTLPETLAWLEKIKFYGDFRYRYEYRDRDWKGGSTDRHRIRARVGFKYDMI